MTRADIDQIHREAEGVLRRVAVVMRSRKVAATDVFSTAFMREHTGFVTFDEMVAASGVIMTASIGDLEANEQWHRFVIAMSRFGSWTEMKRAAIHEWLADQLGFLAVRARRRVTARSARIEGP